MAVAHSFYNLPRKPRDRRRRDATAIMAGRFDPLPERDVLTSCLNHIGPYLEVEQDEEERHKRKQEKKLREKEKKRAKAETKAAARRLKEQMGTDALAHASTGGIFAPTSSLTPVASSSSMKFVTRPTIHIPAMQHSFSVTPSPPTSPQFIISTPGSTPGPSISSSTSRTSSKRPRTPYDDEDEMFGDDQSGPSAPKIRKKRSAVKKGWKGWVEGSPEPSEKLINLDAVPVLHERRTRSGKNFDAIGVGKDGWV